MRSVQIPQPVSQYLALRWRELSADQKQEVAKSIIEVSSHYQNREGLNTPWKNHELAYLFYFFPLNLARGCGLFESLKDLLPSAHENSFDLGAGLGNL
ncbi:MAG: hypothetical protein GW917_04080, partial [Bdellovibrionales bacterium]|nr:hypothetical protein [Bdellovibrionales bacterium]